MKRLGVLLGACWLLGVALPAPVFAVDPPSRSAPQVVPSAVERIGATENANLDIDGVDDNRLDVDIAILDTGIQHDHPDLNVVARTNCTGATWPYSGPDYECTNALLSDGVDDEEGRWHGTYSAARVAALDNGIGIVGAAAGARLWSVDVSGQERYGPLPFPDPLPYAKFDLEQVIAGVRWVTERADQIEVVHMPIVCAPEPPEPLPPCLGTDEVDLVAELEDAITDSIAAGVVYVISAGILFHMDTFAVQRVDDVLVSSQLADSDGRPGSLGPNICGAVDDHSTSDSSWGLDVDVASPGCAGSASMAQTTAAAAILASQDNPNNLADVRAIVETIAGDRDCAINPPDTTPNVGAGNCNWTDDSPDGVKEPALDVSDENVFDPAPLRADETDHIFYRGANGQLNQYTFSPDGPETHVQLGYGGHMVGDPAAVVGLGGGRFVFYQNATGQLHQYWEFSPTNWNHSVHGMASHMDGSPAAVLGHDGSRHVFYRGANGQLNQYTFSPGGVEAHVQLGYAGHMVGDPAAVIGPDGRRYVYYQDATGQLHQYWEMSPSSWNHSVHGPPNHVGGDPAVVLGGDGARYVFYRGANGQLNQYTFLPGGGETHVQLGYAGHMVGDPTAVIGPNGRRYVYYQDATGQLHQYWETSPTSWNHSVHGALSHMGGDPAALIATNDARLVFYRQATGILNRYEEDGASSAFTSQGAIGNMAGDPAVVARLTWD